MKKEVEDLLTKAINFNNAEELKKKNSRNKSSKKIPKNENNKNKSKVSKRQKRKENVKNNGAPIKKIDFQFLACKCAYNCKYLDNDTRKNIFDHYWQLESWDSQTNFLITTTKQVILLLFLISLTILEFLKQST